MPSIAPFEGDDVKKLLVTLFGLVCASSVGAQDFLQQWRDTATQNMNDFRAANAKKLEAAGWKFVAGAQSVERVPLSDLHIANVKARAGKVRSADVLDVGYLPFPESTVAEYQSAKSVTWFDCGAKTFEHRRYERFTSVDGSGAPTSAEEAKADTAPADMKHPDHGSVMNDVLDAVCAAKL